MSRKHKKLYPPQHRISLSVPDAHSERVEGQSFSTGKPASKLYAGLGGVGILFVLALLYYVFVAGTPESGDKPSQSKSGPETGQSSVRQLYDQTVQRAYAIDKLFRQVYTPGWQGANGAIGDAYLFAATGDQSLLYAFANIHKLTAMENGTWVDDRAWVCLAEMYWWKFTGKTNAAWVEDAKQRYLEAKAEGRLSHHEGFWSWYSWPSTATINDLIFTNTNMDLMASVACWLYEATGDRQFYNDAILVWDGDSKYPGIEKLFYKGNGVWVPKEGPTFVGGQFPWMGAGCCSIGASLYKMTGNTKYKEIAVATAKRIMDPANGWVDGQDYYQIRMDGNGAFVNFIVDAYEIAPGQLSDVPGKIARMLEHVWTNHHGTATVTLHRLTDDAIRNGWSPNGGEMGYGVDEIGTVHAQSQAVRAYGVFAYVLRQQLNSGMNSKLPATADSSR
ncbi:MAG TPA: hypothetical protein VI758_07180 [Bacteroidota bacterium]